MRLTNTSRYSNDLIKAVIGFVRPSGISNFDVHVKNTAKIFAGAAYYEGCGYNGGVKPLIVIRISKDLAVYPYRIIRDKKNGYLSFTYYSDLELLVNLMAHELRHLWQHKQKNRHGYVWGSRGKMSERDADAYAIHMVRRFRREGLCLE